MDLTLKQYPVRSILWGETTQYRDGSLSVNKENIQTYLMDAGALDEVAIVEMALISPATATRVVNIFDVFPAHTRLGESAFNYPGFLEPMQTVGNGSSAELNDFSVLAISSRPSSYNKVLDKSGWGAELTPQSKHYHLAFRAEPKDADMGQVEYEKALRRIGLLVGTYLAKAAASTSPADTTDYALRPVSQPLPRAVYVFMLASHQRSTKGASVLYGDDTSGLLPTVLHPNEILDGAVMSPWNLCIDTYTVQKNPVVKELYRRHNHDVDFAGVVVCAAHVEREQRERSIQMTSSLVSEVLKADMAVLTKVGGGIPESDLMMTIERLESEGVSTAAVTWSHMGEGTIEDSLTAYATAADAVASAGINDAWVGLDAQETVIGGTTVGPFTNDPNEKPQPAHGAIRIRNREICGAISQLGDSYVAMEEL